MLNTKLHDTVDFSGQNFYVGIDVHKRSWSVTVRSVGIQVAHFSQPPSPSSLSATLNRKFPGGVFYSAYEAGFSGTGTHEQLCKLSIDNIIVNAADIPLTDKQKKNKTDLHDSRSIAENLERNNLHGIHVLTREQQELRSLFRLRLSKVKDVTRATNRLKGFLIYFGIEISTTVTKTDAISQKVLKWLGNIELASESGTISLKQHIEALKQERLQLSQITKLLHKQIQESHQRAYNNLLSVPGIGATTAIGLIAELADFNRFSEPDQYCSYLGLMPWNDSSGGSIRTKGIQPRCNKYLRPLLIEASWVAIMKNPELLRYYRKHAVKNNKHAIVKVARKLALIARAVVIKEQDYKSNYSQKR